MNSPIDAVIERLQDVSGSAGQWQSRCPAHDDKTASLSIKEGDDGRVLLNCHAGCTASDIAAAIGLKMADLFVKTDGSRLPSAPAAHRNPPSSKATPKPKKIHQTIEKAINAARYSVTKQERCEATFVQKWEYQNANDEVVLVVLRFNLDKEGAGTGKPPKTFRPIHVTDDGFALGDPSGPLPLYRLCEVVATQDEIVVLEGEKAADAAASIGLNATTSAHGAKSAKKTNWSPLAGKRILLMPDAGEAGGEYEKTVLAILRKLDPAPTVRTLRLPGLADGQDIVEWIARFRKEVTPDPAEAKVEVLRLADAAEVSASPPDEESPDEEDEQELVPLGEHDPGTGKLVLSPSKTLPTARAYLNEFYKHPEGRALHFYAGQLMGWKHNRYIEVEDGAIQQRLQPWLHKSLRYQKTRDGEMELVGFDSNPKTVSAALTTIQNHTHLGSRVIPPMWLDNNPELPDPRFLLPYRSATLDMATDQIIPASPKLFNVNAIDFDYDPAADPPERFIRFLEQLWGDDTESTDLLMEFIGYCLVGDITQQKMLFIQGPKRAGKGTLGRLIKKLVGTMNVVAPTTESLAITFGLQPLIGKSVAIISDANFVGAGISTVVERLKTISGADEITIHRKNQKALTLTLPTRFIILSNELPNMKDASGALASRFMILQLTKTFFGVEDTTLDKQLQAELPGILNMAVEGYRRLMMRGHFVQPASVQAAVEEMHDLASPVSAFIREECTLHASRSTSVNLLYAAWQVYCQNDGIEAVGTKEVFCRNLYAAQTGLTRLRLRDGEDRVRHIGGVQLKLGIAEQARIKLSGTNGRRYGA